MNYKDFKKVSSDKRCTTLRHKDGHELKIAHHVLTPKLKEELDKLPEQKIASGGMVHKYADGGDTDQGISTDPSTGAAAPVVINVGGQSPVSDPNERGPVKTPVPEQSQDQKDYDFYSNHASEYPFYARRAKELDAKLNPAPASVPSTPMLVSPEDPGQQAPSQPSSPPTMMQASKPAEVPQDQSQDDSQEAPAQIADQAPATQATPTTPAQQTPYEKGFNEYYQENAQKLGQEDAAWQHDLANGHVTPETYHSLFAKKDTLGKIGTIFGLMMSGAGSGLSHQPNALLASMNQEINNDLAAQNKSKDNAQNYLKLHQMQQMNEAQIAQLGKQGALTDAQAKAEGARAEIESQTAALMKMNRVALHNQVLQVQKMPEGPMKEQAKQALAMMGSAVDAKNANLSDVAASQMSLVQAMGGSGQNGISSTALKLMGKPELAKDQDEKTIPGIPGRASQPMNDDFKDRVNSGVEFDQKLHRFIDWTKTHSGDLNPADRNTGVAMAAELQGAYRQATHGGVYKEGEQNFISRLIDSEPTKFFNNIRVVPQLNAIANENKSRVNQLLKSKGLSYPGVQQSQNSAPQYKTVGGVKYMRGPNGEAIRVK